MFDLDSPFSTRKTSLFSAVFSFRRGGSLPDADAVCRSAWTVHADQITAKRLFRRRRCVSTRLSSFESTSSRQARAQPNGWVFAWREETKDANLAAN